MYTNVSVTNLAHRTLACLEAAPFSDLCATDRQGRSEYYSFDVFRRLYNDAVESMLHYKKLAEDCRTEAEGLSLRCRELECQLMELTDTDG